MRRHDIFDRVGSAVVMAAFTTFLAGLSMYPSRITSFTKMGQFLMLVMCSSYLFATFFFVPMCALFGPTQDFGNIKLREWTLFFISLCSKKSKKKTTNHDSNNNKNNNDNENCS
jgi:predicted RND superfamily exporter protein